MNDWTVPGSKDPQSVTPDWRTADAKPIDGVLIREVAHVPTDNGYLTEMLRPEWLRDGERTVEQVFQRYLEPGAISAWHAHGVTTDRLFCVAGRVLVVLYDARRSSPTSGVVAEHRIGVVRPTLLIVPPGVFHGVRNLGAEPAILVNMVDKAYRYDDPDHWRAPLDSADIPYTFKDA